VQPADAVAADESLMPQPVADGGNIATVQALLVPHSVCCSIIGRGT